MNTTEALMTEQNLDHVQIRPVSGTIGLEISGIDLRRDLTNSEWDFVHAALLDNLVLFFAGQQALSPADLRRFAGRFGEPDTTPFYFPFVMPTEDGFPEIYNMVKEAADRSVNLGGFWHAAVEHWNAECVGWHVCKRGDAALQPITYRERPQKAGIIYAKECPAYGGDTMFANQYLAYETLSDGMKSLLEGLQAVHSNLMEHGGEEVRFGAVSKDHAATAQDRAYASKPAEQGHVEAIENTHPVVRAHPETGRKCLYVNRAFTLRFAGMTNEESLPLLEFLWQHACRPEFTCRYAWSRNAVAVWGNRCVHHYAVNDYFGERRHMQKITIHEESRPSR